MNKFIQDEINIEWVFCEKPWSGYSEFECHEDSPDYEPGESEYSNGFFIGLSPEERAGMIRTYQSKKVSDAQSKNFRDTRKKESTARKRERQWWK